MFFENTKSMLYLFFIIPFLMALSLIGGAAVRSSGLIGVASFLLVFSALIVGFLVYSKFPNFKEGRLYTFGIADIPGDRKWAYKASFHMLVAFYFVTLVLISGLGS